MLDRVDALTAARRLLHVPDDGSGDPSHWNTDTGRVCVPSPSPDRLQSGQSAPATARPSRAVVGAIARLPECAGYRFTPFGWQAETDLLVKRKTRVDAEDEARMSLYRRGVIAHALFAQDPRKQWVRRWLKARFIDAQLVPDAIDRLLEVAGMVYGFAGRGDAAEGFVVRSADLGGRPARLLLSRAMVGMIEGPPGSRAGALHATYLAHKGYRKASAYDGPGRKVWAGTGGARGGVWLTDRTPRSGPLFVAEGIETVLSVLAEYRRREKTSAGRALAVISLDNLQGGVAKDKFGRWRLHPLEADPARLPVVWPNAGDVVICPDHDMRPIRVKVRGGETELDASARMDLSAQLSAAAWRAAGAASVSVLRPPLGMDFNDAAREKMLRRHEVQAA
ncbi:MAG: hypothetical protein AAFY47_05280 [Pseudomonadota bacterium]